MRKNITINNKKYIFDDQIRDNLAVRTGFDRLAQQTFDISFEEWHKGGWWQENYQPHLAAVRRKGSGKSVGQPHRLSNQRRSAQDVSDPVARLIA